MLCWFWSRSFCGAFEKNADCEPTDLEMLFGVMCGTRCNPGTGNKNWRNGWGRYYISLVPIPTYIPKITNKVRVLTYRQVYNIRRTKYQHLQGSRTVLRLPLPNPLKPDVQSRMKMCRQAMLRLHLSDRQFYCLLGAPYIKGFTVFCFVFVVAICMCMYN